jgi:hypothetical protein
MGHSIQPLLCIHENLARTENQCADPTDLNAAAIRRWYSAPRASAQPAGLPLPSPSIKRR